MELPAPWTTVPGPGGPTEHSGEKHFFVVDTFSVKGDPEGHTCGVHMCGCVRGSLGLPHLGQMRRARIESPGKSSCPPLASDPSASHGAPWSLSTWHIWQAPPPQACPSWALFPGKHFHPLRCSAQPRSLPAPGPSSETSLELTFCPHLSSHACPCPTTVSWGSDQPPCFCSWPLLHSAHASQSGAF